MCVILFAVTQQLVYAQLNTTQKEKIKQYEQLIKDNNTTAKQKKVAAYYAGKKANIYLKVGMYTNAISSYNEAASIYSSIGLDNVNRKIYNNIAMVYAEMNQLKNTLKYFNKSLNISRRYNNRHDISVSLMDVSTIHIYNKNYNLALELLQESLRISNDLNDARLLRTCYNLLYQCYNAYGNKKLAKHNREFFELYDKQVKEQSANIRDKESKEKINKSQKELDIALTAKRAKELEYSLLQERQQRSEDSLNNQLLLSEETKKRVELEKKQVELEKQKAEKEKEKQEKIAQYQIALADKKQAENDLYGMYLIAAAIGGLLLTITIIIGIFAFKEKQKANRQLEFQNIEIAKQRDELERKTNDLQYAMEKIQDQNKNILHSINYAKRIQDAMLPKQHMMKDLFVDSFIFFKPRDVVSGDFYWFNQVIKQNTKKILISAVDCTGHGVPGAFMSMLGFNLLNDIAKSGIIEPEKMLDKLNEGVRNSLNQDKTENKDGMDMTLCVIDTADKTIEFSGAQNSLIYVQDQKIYRVRGNKFPIGGYQFENKFFTKHIIKADKPTYCYMFSDGYTDQFGGKNNKKFMAKNLRELLFEIHQMPMEEQKKILGLVMEEWMGTQQQTDDMLILGFKLDL